MSSLGFKARVGSALFAFCEGKCSVHSTRCKSGATHNDLLTASITTGHFPTCMSRGGSWLGFKQAITHTEDECTNIVPATWLFEMFTSLNFIIFLQTCLTIISNFTFFPCFNKLQSFVQIIRKSKWTAIVSCMTVTGFYFQMSMFCHRNLLYDDTTIYKINVE